MIFTGIPKHNTPRQRLLIYKRTLRIFMRDNFPKESSYKFFLCGALEEASKLPVRGCSSISPTVWLTKFPEFMTLKPEDVGWINGWFETRAQRVSKMKSLIKKMEKQLNKKR